MIDPVSFNLHRSADQQGSVILRKKILDSAFACLFVARLEPARFFRGNGFGIYSQTVSCFALQRTATRMRL